MGCFTVSQCLQSFTVLNQRPWHKRIHVSSGFRFEAIGSVMQLYFLCKGFAKTDKSKVLSKSNK